jgi:predicted Zn-dependent protease
VRQALDALRIKAASDPAAALKEAQILHEAYPSNPQVAIELAQLLAQAGQPEEAARTAGAAIKAALSAGVAPLAVETWKGFERQRDGLDLDVGALEALGRQLTNRKELGDAAWCFRSMKTKGADALRVQKGLIGVADATARDGNTRGAAQLYRFILSEFPQSSLRDYIESAIAQLDLKAAPARR